jgi:hypothetical protein
MKHFFQGGCMAIAACLSAGACAAGSPTSWFTFEDAGPGLMDAWAPDGREESDARHDAPDGAPPAEDSDAPDAPGASCRGRCASPSSPAGCQCDPACAVHQDCCSDYASACGVADAAPQPALSCAGQCRDAANSAGCACDPGCVARGTCCADFASACPAPDAGSPHAGSCIALCGVKGPSGQCHCDPSCVTYADCCADYTAVCGDGG